MKRIIILMAVLIGATTLYAQEPVFNKGDKVVNLGIGLTSYINGCLSFEMGIADGIIDKGTIGAGIYAGAGYGYYWGSSARFVGGVRGTFHYPLIEKFDTYLGLGAGLSYIYYFNSSDVPWVDIDGFIGGRYLFSEKMSFYVEMGASLGYINGGISIWL
ncbi:MAG: hypothetical protein JW801_02175 [Bacteroidales bacterium]|nr:hypothetical protein [Bacteroidales bacterium]